jgi:riboflavin biosynthesis pyrimidine reductase
VIRDLVTGRPLDDLDAAVRAEERTAHGRPWVMLNMVTSIDGATAVDGGSTPLSDDDDRALFRALRRVADVIVVGSGTVEAEDYRPDARLVIVSGRLSIDPSRRVFSDPEQRPTVVGSSQADPAKVAALREVANVELLEDLSGSNVIGLLPAGSIVLCEGGPTLNSSLFQTDVVDEINWAVAPLVVGGKSNRMTSGDALGDPSRYRLARSWMGEETLFLRYVRA